MTFSQKVCTPPLPHVKEPHKPLIQIVQVRMWAQGVTVAVLIASALVSNAERKKNKEQRVIDHSWMTQVCATPFPVPYSYTLSFS